MATGKLREVELDAYRIQEKRFKEQEEERAYQESKRVGLDVHAQKALDQFEQEQRTAQREVGVDGAKLDTTELYKPEQGAGVTAPANPEVKGANTGESKKVDETKAKDIK